MRDFYEHSYANVHRGVYRLAERATTGYETAREQGRGLRERAVGARGDLHAQRDRGAEPRRVRLGPRQPRPGRRRRRHRSRAPLELRPVAVRRGSHGRCVQGHPDRRVRRASPRRARRDRARGHRQGGRFQPRLEHARHGESRAASSRRGRTSAARSWSSTPRRPRRTDRSTSRRSTASSSRSRRTRCAGRAAIGALWGRRELLETMAPFNLGGEMIRSVSMERTTWNELPYKFEAGTPAIAEAVGFGTAVDYVLDVGPRGDRGSTSASSSSTRSATRRASLDLDLRPVRRAPRRHRLLQRRRRPSARRRAGPRLGGRRRSRGPPLHAAAHVASSASPRRFARASTCTRSPRRSTASWTGSTRRRRASASRCPSSTSCIGS